MNKLTKEQQAKVDELFQLNHLYFLLDGALNLTLPEGIVNQIELLQSNVQKEHYKLAEEIKE